VGETKPVATGGVSTARVLMIVIPLALVAVVVFGLYVTGALNFLEAFVKPALVESKGVVYWNGNILKGGEINTQHETKGVRGATGYIKADGTFVLTTQVNGEFVDGAYAGQHKVTIRQIDRLAPRGASMPPPGSPEKYLDFATTDLTINVVRDASKNSFRLEMSGAGPKGQMNTKEEEELANTPKPKPLSPEERVAKMLEDNDADKDGKLSAQEQGGLGFQYAKGLGYSDLDKDGFLSKEELLKMVQ